MFRQVKRWLRASNADLETEPATLAGLNASELQLTEVTTDADDRARLHEMEYSEPGNSSYSLEFNNLTYSVKPKKRGSKRLVILDKVSGHCASGRVLAVHTLFFPSSLLVLAFMCRCWTHWSSSSAAYRLHLSDANMNTRCLPPVDS